MQLDDFGDRRAANGTTSGAVFPDFTSPSAFITIRILSTSTNIPTVNYKLNEKSTPEIINHCFYKVILMEMGFFDNPT
uniref:Bm14127 n=1 Tax=Brugia malayi TaxID=6279 RepID=A0A1I9G0B3_BRUMA|nr:Bm14127 [Brugia malayi]